MTTDFASDVSFTGLHCLNDYNNNITCEWNSSYVSDQRAMAADTECTLSVSIIMDDEEYEESCGLKPFDDSKTMRRCSLVYSYMNYVSLVVLQL